MSIIYDALKKAEKIIHTDLRTGINPELKPRQSKSKIKIIALYLLMVSLGLFIGNAVFVLLSRPVTKLVKCNPDLTKPAQKSEPVVKTQDLTLPLASPKPSPVKNEPQKAYVLNGIFSSNDEGYALINNKIVKVGDEVDGAVVLRITTHEVELNALGVTIKLTRLR